MNELDTQELFEERDFEDREDRLDTMLQYEQERDAERQEYYDR